MASGFDSWSKVWPELVVFVVDCSFLGPVDRSRQESDCIVSFVSFPVQGATLVSAFSVWVWFVLVSYFSSRRDDGAI